MQSKMKNSLKFIIPTAIGLIAAVLIMFSKDVLGQETSKQVFSILSDAFFVPGVCLAGVGAIVWASSGGVFDMLAYGVICFFDTFRKDITKRKYKDFYEYRQAKKGEGRNLWFLLVVGLAFIAIAVVMLLVYTAV